MMSASHWHEAFKTRKVCVLIPTYNNQQTLAHVISDVAAYTSDIIVVNDGSTDNTLQILKGIDRIQLVSYTKNVGKGWALRQGLKYAASTGYDYAITIDSDGQHFAKDLPAFLAKLETSPNSIIIGARNMDQASVPGKSSFGNKFSNFWFKVETGINMPDTQSGYRLYPLQPLKKVKFITRKYEFEIEVLVRAAWRGVKVESVPVTVYYAPKGTRISHFRPFKDFTRISILNTILVFITFFYIKPRDFFRTLFNKKKLKQAIRDHVLRAHESDRIKAVSIGFGVFMGIIPIWGFQLVVAIALAILFRLNKALVIIAANISIPPMIPVIIFLSYLTGRLWMGDRAVFIDFSAGLNLDTIKANIEQYLYGSTTLAIIAGITAGLVSWILLKVFKKRNLNSGEMNQTV